MSSGLMSAELKMEARPWIGDVVVEVAMSRNCNLSWGPTQQILRGRFSRDEMLPNESSTEGIWQLPEIPGQWIMVHGREKKVGILDPLNDPANSEVFRRIISSYKAIMGLSQSGVEFTGEPNVIRE